MRYKTEVILYNYYFSSKATFKLYLAIMFDGIIVILLIHDLNILHCQFTCHHLKQSNSSIRRYLLQKYNYDFIF
jgi:hypothetical protein